MENPVALLIRHGHDQLSDADVFVSWTDVPLTDEGREQGRAAKEFLDQFDIQLVYSSPLIRSIEMAEMLDMEVRQERALLPWNRGVMTGVRQEEGKDALGLFSVNPDVRIPGGESRREAEDRIETFFTPALRAAESKTTAFFTHHSVIDLLNGLLKGERDEEPENLVKTGGVVGVFVDGDSYCLEPLLRADKKATSAMS